LLLSVYQESGVDLQISARKFGNVTILDLRGRIVIGPGNDSFKVELRKLAENPANDVLINMAGVTQIDSSGIGILVRSFVALRHNGRSLKILNPTEPVSEILKVTGLVNSLPAYTDEAKALASFSAS
jgi:anti-sigma B factor antagonist